MLYVLSVLAEVMLAWFVPQQASDKKYSFRYFARLSVFILSTFLIIILPIETASRFDVTVFFSILIPLTVAVVIYTVSARKDAQANKRSVK